MNLYGFKNTLNPRFVVHCTQLILLTYLNLTKNLFF
jgi:hypothetical protein